MLYQDIQLGDIELKSQYITLWMNGQYTEAFNILSNNPQLDSKAFVAECSNLIFQAIMAIEEKYDNDVNGFLALKLTEYNEAIDQFKQMGEWSAQIAYVVGNFVTHNNKTYLCIQDNINHEPPTGAEDEYWVEIMLNGPEGSPGLDVNLKYAWSGAVTYAPRDVVYYKDGLYIATQASLNQPPSDTSEYWNVFLKMPRAKIIVSQTSVPPDELYDGLIWFRIMVPLTWAQVDAKNVTFEDIDNMNQTWAFIDEGGW